MLIILLISTLLLFFFVFSHQNINTHTQEDFNTQSKLTYYRKPFIQAVLSTFALLFIFTEVLSFFNKITGFWIGICWASSTTMLLALFIYKYLSQKKNTLTPIFHQKHIDNNYKLIIIMAGILIVLPLCFIAIFYPPNTADSMVYHLPRIEHWIQNKNIDHYPTPDVRQLFHQPFGEFILLHIRLLTGSDLWFNMLQFFLMICSLILVSLITKLFGLDYKYQILSSILALTIPMGIMQATSTQTDYVAAFFLLAFIFFALLLMRQNKIYYTNIIFGSLALGFGMLTKLTTIIFAIPFCIWFAVYFVKNHKTKAIKAAIIAISLLITINLPFYVRNYRTTGNIVGETHISNMMKNDTLNVPFFFSNIIRNITIHFSLPIQSYNNVIDTIVEKIHYNVLQISPHEKEISFCGEKYKTRFFMDDGSAGNFLLLILIMLLFFYILFNIKKLFYSEHKEILWYGVSLISGFFIFCAVFKWQPWHSRLHLPFFIASVPVVTFFLYAICSNKSSWIHRTIIYATICLFGLLSIIYLLSQDHVHNRIFYFLVIIILLLVIILFRKLKKLDLLTRTIILPLIILALPYVFFNPTRPLFLNKPVVTSARNQKYFVAQWSDEYTRQYTIGVQLLQDLNIKKLVISLDFIYPTWPMLKSKNHEIEIQEINFKDIYRSTRNFNGYFEYQAVFTSNDNMIDLYDKNNIASYTILGPKTKHHNNLKLIVFKKPENKFFKI